MKRVIVVDAEDVDPMLYRQTQRCLDLVDRLGIGNPDALAVLDLVEFAQTRRSTPRTDTLLAAYRRVVEAARRGMVCVGCEHWPGGDNCPYMCDHKPLRLALAALDELEAHK